MNHIVWWLNWYILQRRYCRCGCGSRVKAPIPKYTSYHNPRVSQMMRGNQRAKGQHPVMTEEHRLKISETKRLQRLRWTPEVRERFNETIAKRREQK